MQHTETEKGGFREKGVGVEAGGRGGGRVQRVSARTTFGSNGETILSTHSQQSTSQGARGRHMVGAASKRKECMVGKGCNMESNAVLRMLRCWRSGSFMLPLHPIC